MSVERYDKNPVLKPKSIHAWEAQVSLFCELFLRQLLKGFNQSSTLILEVTDNAGNISIGATNYATPYIIKPDLIVESVTSSSYIPFVGENITITAVVKNVGNAAAKSFNVSLYKNLDTPPSNSSSGDMTKTVTSLAKDSSITISFANVSRVSEGPDRNTLPVTKPISSDERSYLKLVLTSFRANHRKS
jgi:hypothetical protein